MKHTYNLDYFYRGDEISYYLLGAYMTDGCVYRGSDGWSFGVHLSSKDTDWLEIIRDLVCPTQPIKYQKNGGSYIVIYNTELGQWLIEKGCVERKSLTLKFPKVPEKYMPDFLRGCIDGDGRIAVNYNTKIYKGKQTTYEEWSCYLCSSS